MWLISHIDWYPHRESNPELTLIRGLLSPFNYRGVKLALLGAAC